MAIGIFLLIIGLPLAITPLGAAKFAGRLRYVPFRDTSDAVRLYRVFGVAISGVGALLVVLSL